MSFEISGEPQPGLSPQKIVEALYGKNSIPHPPYDGKMGKLETQRVDSYIEHHVAPNYLGGLVVFGDEDLSASHTRAETMMFKTDQLPELPNLEQYRAIPSRVAVGVAEMRNGIGDIYEGVSAALMIQHAGIDTTLVMPRDKISYEKTINVLGDLGDAPGQLGLEVRDYHEIYGLRPFDLSIYPSTQRHVGTIPSHASVLLRETGESNTRAGVSWRDDSWGGITAYFNTGYSPSVDKYGAIPPIATSIEASAGQLTSEEQRLLQQLKESTEGGREPVIMYPGSNNETEAINFIRIYMELLARFEQPVIAVAPGGQPEIASLENEQFKVIATGKVRNTFLSFLLRNYISKDVPSLVAGSMSMAEAMHSGIPFFYKTELWKEGNADRLTEIIEQIGLKPILIEGGRSKGMLRDIQNIEGSPVNVLSYAPTTHDASRKLGVAFKNAADEANSKMLPALFGWYGLLTVLKENAQPDHFKETVRELLQAKS